MSAPRAGTTPSGNRTKIPPVSSAMTPSGGSPTRPGSAVTPPRTWTVDPTAAARATLIVVGPPVGVGVGVGDGVTVGVAVGLELGLGVGVGVGVGLGVGVGATDGDGDGAGSPVGVGDGDGAGSSIRSSGSLTKRR